MTEPEPEDQDGLVRPFLLTGGRTRPAREGLRVETLVRTREGARSTDLRFESRKIVETCRRPTSVAEIASALRVPFGVARVLVSDLIGEGLVTVVEHEELSLTLIERIRDRVRAL